MPSSIPFDHPSLVLGNIINPKLLKVLKQIGSLQNRTDAAQQRMNSNIGLKRSLNMTLNEMLDMGIDVTDLKVKVNEVDQSIITAAKDYMGIRIANETDIQSLRDQVSNMEIDESIESPLDFEATKIKKIPLSSDSLKLDAQYFHTKIIKIRTVLEQLKLISEGRQRVLEAKPQLR